MGMRWRFNMILGFLLWLRLMILPRYLNCLSMSLTLRNFDVFLVLNVP